MACRPLRPPAGQRGFTLVELLITMTVMIVMLGIAVPSFRSFTAGQRVKTAASDMAATLVMARSEAIKRNASVTVAPLAGTDWSSGWIVTAGTVEALRQNAVGGVTFSGAPASIVYQSTGRVAASSKLSLASSVDASIARCVKVDLTGIPSTSQGACP